MADNYNYYEIDIQLNKEIKYITQISNNDTQKLVDYIKTVKAYIFSIPILKERFINNVKYFRKYKDSKGYNKFLNDFTKIFKEQKYNCLLKNDVLNPLIAPSSFYFIDKNQEENLFGEDDTVCVGIASYYFHLIEEIHMYQNTDLDFELEEKFRKDFDYNLYRNFIDYYVISELNIYLSTYITNVRYYKCALLGVLNDLRNFVYKKQIEYYTKDSTEITKAMIRLTPAEEDLLREICNGGTLPKVAERMNKSIDTIESQKKSIDEKIERLNLEEYNKLKPLPKLRKFAEVYFK